MQKTATSFTPSTLSQYQPYISFLKSKIMWTLLLGGGIIWALAQTNLWGGAVINPRGWPLARRFLAASLHPEVSFAFLWLTLQATLTTLSFAVLGTGLSLIIGFAGGILASEVWWKAIFPQQRHALFRLPWFSVRVLLALLRAIHEVIWGLFFVNVIGLDPLTAILAIGLPFGGVTAKIFAEILDETPRQPFINLKNSGVTPLKAFIYTLLPQALPDLISYTFYRFECSIRAAAVLGMIGAGGLGYELFLSLQSLKYEQIWTLFFALFILNGLTDFWSALVRRHLGGHGRSRSDACFELNMTEQTPTASPRQGANQVIRMSVILILGLIPFAFWFVSPDLSKLIAPRTITHLAEVQALAFPPDFTIFSGAEWFHLTTITVAMSLLAVAGAGLLSIVLAFPAANNFFVPGGFLNRYYTTPLFKLGGWLILLITRTVLLIMRAIPPPIWALILLFVMFPGILPGAIALGLYTLGVLGRLVAEVVENLDDRPLLALSAQGATASQVFVYGVLPPIAPRFIGYVMYRWEETIRATVVIGLVGAGGLGRVLTEQLSSFYYQGVLTTLIIFIGLTLSVDLISTVARRTFREG